MTWSPPSAPDGGWPRPPAEVAHLVQILGIPATFALVEARGGTRLYVPMTPTPELESLIGPEAAYELAKAWGRCMLKVPLARTWRIRVQRARGASYSEIALTMKCTVDSVWRVLSQSPSQTRHRRSAGPRDQRRGEAAS